VCRSITCVRLAVMNYYGGQRNHVHPNPAISSMVPGSASCLVRSSSVILIVCGGNAASIRGIA